LLAHSHTHSAAGKQTNKASKQPTNKQTASGQIDKHIYMARQCSQVKTATKTKTAQRSPVQFAGDAVGDAVAVAVAPEPRT